MTAPSFQTFALTGLAMTAFAANSVLGRLGLVEGDIGAGSFALIRLLAGALVLALLAGPKNAVTAGSWAGGAALFIYAAFFSYAYLALPAGTGALILFAVVQITMIGAGFLAGERFTIWQWLGFTGALGALIWLLSPGLQAPPLLASLAMALAGIGWGMYSLIGRSAAAPPTQNTAGNFLRAALIGAVLLLPLVLAVRPEQIPAPTGILLAILSGAVTSGLGYAIWYMALKSLSATHAGVAQLTVPAIAALGGIIFLSEPMSLRFLMASGIILSGVAITTLTGKPPPATGKTD